MVATRRSLSRADRPLTSDDETKTLNSERKNSRKTTRRKQQGQALRQRSTGLGLSIQVDTERKANQKIVFANNASEGEDELPSDKEKPQTETKLKTSVVAKNRDDSQNSYSDDDDDDDDDDAVEEVKQAAAREEIETLQSRERISARAVVATAKGRKRKKKTVTEQDHLDDNLPEDFFNELDAELANERKQNRQKLVDNAARKGKHTTFVVKEDDKDTPVNVDEHMQLVILNQSEREASLPNRPLSKDALIFSRSQLLDGKDKTSNKQRLKDKKAGRKRVEPQGWKRSKKMNRLWAPGRQSLRKEGKGAVAPLFVVEGR